MTIQEAKAEIVKRAQIIANSTSGFTPTVTVENLEYFINLDADRIECEVSREGVRCKLARYVYRNIQEQLVEIAENLPKCGPHDIDMMIELQKNIAALMREAYRILRANNGDGV